jgi:ferritin-like metal-binding protein YciE
MKNRVPMAKIHRFPFVQNKIAENENAMAELKKIYWHEKETLIAIPILLSCATTFELVESLILLMRHTREHIKALEEKFPNIGQPSHVKKTYKSLSYKDLV